MNKLKIGFITLLILLSAVFTATKVLAAATFQGGNIYIVSNASAPAWADPVNAQVNNLVEFKVDITNLGPDTVATNVRVKADLPTNVSGNTISSTIHIVADNVPEVTDTATVNITNAAAGSTHNLVYYPGHAVVIRHPENTQASLEAIGSGGWVSLGDLSKDNSAYLEVAFKAQLTEQVVVVPPSPSPSPSPAPSVAPSPSPSPAPQQGGVVSCPAGTTQTVSGNTIVCIQNQQQQNVSQTQTNNQNVNVTQNQPAAAPAAPAVAGVKVTQLPKTGLPAFLALGLAGLLPLGMRLRKTFSVKEEMSDHPTYLWEQREFKKAS